MIVSDAEFLGRESDSESFFVTKGKPSTFLIKKYVDMNGSWMTYDLQY